MSPARQRIQPMRHPSPQRRTTEPTSVERKSDRRQRGSLPRAAGGKAHTNLAKTGRLRRKPWPPHHVANGLPRNAVHAIRSCAEWIGRRARSMAADRSCQPLSTARCFRGCAAMLYTEFCRVFPAFRVAISRLMRCGSNGLSHDDLRMCFPWVPRSASAQAVSSDRHGPRRREPWHPTSSNNWPMTNQSWTFTAETTRTE